MERLSLSGLLRKIYDPVTMKSVITEYTVLYLFKLYQSAIKCSKNSLEATEKRSSPKDKKMAYLKEVLS